MGQGIGFTEKAVQIPYPVDMDTEMREDMIASECIFFHTSWIRDHPWSYPEIDTSLLLDSEGVFATQYSYGPVGQVACSYGAWAEFQEELCRHFVGVTMEQMREDPKVFHGRAMFFHLVAQRDSEGIICPPAVRLLANDFRCASTTKNSEGTLEASFLQKMRAEDKSLFADIYTELRDGTYYTARMGGLIDFS